MIYLANYDTVILYVRVKTIYCKLTLSIFVTSSSTLIATYVLMREVQASRKVVHNASFAGWELSVCLSVRRC